jgi:hypothetical protein
MFDYWNLSSFNNSIDMWKEFNTIFSVTDIQEEKRFCLLATLNEKLDQKNLFLNFQTDIYYSQGQSHIYLYHFHRPENDRVTKLENLPLLSRIIYSHSAYLDWQQALLWFTSIILSLFIIYVSIISLSLVNMMMSE